MNCRIVILLLLIPSMLSLSAYGQEYLQLMNDQSANMFDIQKAANEYFSKVGRGKGTGYKQYKRWEYENMSKSYPSGKLQNLGPDLAIKELQAFEEGNLVKSISVNKWESLGPDNVNTNNGHYSPGLGRIDRIAIDPKNADVLYIGGPTNGVWKSVNGGANWVAKTDHIGNRGVSSIVIDPVNTDIVYWATGDGDNNSTNCTGIFISDDGGETWNISGLSFAYTEGVKGRKLIMHPDDNKTLLFSCSKGIYKTTDGGKNWQLKQTGNFDDIFYKKNEPQIVYASKVGEFHRSTNGGESFVKVNLELGGRIFIALTDAAPDVVYLMSGMKGIYKSTDKGRNFSFIADHKYTKGQMWHHGTFIVSPNNEKLIHTGEFESHKSIDGGYSWTKTSDWTFPNDHYIHCDIHDFVYAGNKLYVCTDGGVSYTTDEGESWVNLFETMVALEPYRMEVCKTNSNLHMNGSQDNGIYLWDGKRWDGIYGADGMHCLIDYENPNNKYFAIQNGGLNATGKTVAQPGEGAWVSPLIMHPSNSSVMYFGNSKVHKTTDGMQSWTVIGSFGFGNINNLAICESDANYLYASKGARLWRTANEGGEWTEITSGLPNLWITRIAVHPSNPQKVAISVGGYNTGKKVYISDDGGVSWENYSSQLPNIEARCLVFDDSEKDALYLGMDIGIYYIDNTLSEWELYSNGFPMLGVNDLVIHHASQQIFAASLGRGIWKNATKDAPEYCAAAGSNETLDNYIIKVELEDINQESGKDAYSDFTSTFATLTIGSEYAASVTLNAHEPDDKCFAWIDSNNNKVFEDTEQIEFDNYNEQHVAFATFTVSESIAPGFYTMRVRTQSGENVSSPCGNELKGEVEDYSVLIETATLQYCNAAGASGTGGDWIKNVKLNTIDNTSPKSAYSDFTHISTSLEPGAVYAVAVTLNTHFAPDECGAWIDFNQNAVFDEEELVYLPLINASAHEYKANFTVPEGAKSGETRMRVRVIYNNSMVPCNSIFGEVEDYGVNINTITSVNAKLTAVSALRIFPNPATTSLTIELPEWETDSGQLFIYNVKGELMHANNLQGEKKIELAVASYNPGLYFVKFTCHNKSLYSKFVIR